MAQETQRTVRIDAERSRCGVPFGHEDGEGEPDLWENGKRIEQRGYTTDLVAEHAARFIDEHKNEPFFLYLPTNAAHGPHWVPDRFKEPYEGKGPAGFYGMIANVDENVARLDAFLAGQGLLENTIVARFVAS